MKCEELMATLRRMKIETGSLVCMGCGYEHNCGIHGCAIMNMAADHLANDQAHIAALQAEIEKLRSGRRWIPVAERLPDPLVSVIVCRDGVPGERIVEQGHKDIGGWWKVYGTRTKRVTHWMPLPEAPEVEV